MHTATTSIIIVANALISGRNPRRMREKIKTGKVFAPGPETKLAITKSSSDKVNASNQPEISAGVRRGIVIAVNTLKGFSAKIRRSFF